MTTKGSEQKRAEQAARDAINCIPAYAMAKATGKPELFLTAAMKVGIAAAGAGLTSAQRSAFLAGLVFVTKEDLSTAFRAAVLEPSLN